MVAQLLQLLQLLSSSLPRMGKLSLLPGAFCGHCRRDAPEGCRAWPGLCCCSRKRLWEEKECGNTGIILQQAPTTSVLPRHGRNRGKGRDGSNLL